MSPTSPSTSPHPLDRKVREVAAQLKERGVVAPQVLLWLGTGEGQLPDALARHCEVPLAELAAPEPWHTGSLHTGCIGDLALWILEDQSGDPQDLPGRAPWMFGFPAWLAARAGAGVVLHTTAGSALLDGAAPREENARQGQSEPHAPVGGIGLVRDHLNLSGATPLLGLGQSQLGPLFPDLSTLHHIGLRRRAAARAEDLGLVTAEVIAACTPGPALETPAERRLFRSCGADVAVQSLQWPLLACAHAGLGLLSLVAISDAAEGPADVAALVEAAGLQSTQLEDLILSLIPDLWEAAQRRGEDD